VIGNAIGRTFALKLQQQQQQQQAHPDFRRIDTAAFLNAKTAEAAADAQAAPAPASPGQRPCSGPTGAPDMSLARFMV
jgi:hypothetical protein